MSYTYAGSFTTTQSWDKKEITVCFAEADDLNRAYSWDNEFKASVWSKKDKLMAEEWVNSEYTETRTGVNFRGWLDCSETTEAEVILFYNKDNFFKSFTGGVAGFSGSIGEFHYLKLAGYPQAKNFVVINRSGVAKRTLIHEMGHVAGLQHEHLHPNAYNRSCKDIAPRDLPAQFDYTEYDPNSVMNYCNQMKTLSNGDLAILKKHYP
jgi:hypothetical protein